MTSILTVVYFVSRLRLVWGRIYGFSVSPALMEAVRQHGEIENRVHWVLDVSFSEDASRIRRNDGAENFSVTRSLALNVIRQDETSKTKRIKGC